MPQLGSDKLLIDGVGGVGGVLHNGTDDKEHDSFCLLLPKPNDQENSVKQNPEEAMEDVAKSGWTVDKKDGNHWTAERRDSLAGNCNQTIGNNFAQRNEERNEKRNEQRNEKRNEQSNEQCKKGEYRRIKKGKESKVE